MAHSQKGNRPHVAHPGGGHHAHRAVPMVTQSLSRGQFARFVMPTALCLLLFVAYSVLVHIFAFDLDTTQMPWDATIFTAIWTLLVCSFLRGAFSSPGLVQRGWYRRYPLLHQELRSKFKIYKSNAQKQEQWMKRFNRRATERTERAISGGDSNHNDSRCCDDNECNEETTLLIEDDEEELPEMFARPPRSHFCHELGSNVLRMDHFCVWFNNAVGFRNYKYFLLTISYLLIESVLAILILIYRLFIDSYPQPIGLLNVSCLLLTFVICCFFAVFAGMHTWMHWYQMSKNLTSIEYHKFNQVKAMAHHFGVPWPETHEYDDGIMSNCKQWMGDDIWFWCIPTAPSLSGDGHRFESNEKNKAKILRVTTAIQEKRQAMWNRNGLGRKANSNSNTSPSQKETV